MSTTPSPASPSAALMTTTSMSPSSTTSQPVQSQSPPPSGGFNNIESAIQTYSSLRDQYSALISKGLRESDPAKRSEILKQIQEVNQRITSVMNGIAAAYSQGQDQLSSQPSADLQGALERYKQQLEELRSTDDELTKLNSLYGSLHTTHTEDKHVYYGYIVVILILLVIVFVTFTVSVFRSFPSISEMLPSFPVAEPVSYPIASPVLSPALEPVTL